MNNELQFDFSEFEEKFQKLLKSYNVNKKIVYTTAERKIATEVSIRLAKKEVVRNVRDFLLKENKGIHYSIAQIEVNLENCSKSLLLIRQFLEDKAVEIGVVNGDSYLALLIDFALSGVKQFLYFDQYYIVSKKYRREYIDALFKIRSHLLLTIDNMNLALGGYNSIRNVAEYLKGEPGNKKPDKDLYYDISQKELEFPNNLPPYPVNESNSSNSINKSSKKGSTYNGKIMLKWNGNKETLYKIFKYLVEMPHGNTDGPAILGTWEEIKEFVDVSFIDKDGKPFGNETAKRERIGTNRFSLNCNANAFADMFYELQNMKPTSTNGEHFLEEKTSIICKFIIRNFTAREGKEIQYHSIRMCFGEDTSRRPKQLASDRINISRLIS